VESFRRTLAFVAGVVMVFFGVTDDCPRVGAIAVGLLMMGLFTVPEALRVIRGDGAVDDDRTKEIPP
jgi:hypothetical protein